MPTTAAREPDDADYLLRVDGVSKTYWRRGFAALVGLAAPQRNEALRQVSFGLRAGQVTALLGPNGAGKTTLINILCDLARPDAGRVEVAGREVPGQGLQARRLIGYCSTNDRSFFWRLSGRSNLEFFAALQGFDRAEARRRVTEMLDRFNLAAQAEQLFHTYSAGMKKRLGLARAFLHDPSVLLLDEPTSGLDARSTEELLEMVREEIRLRPKTVLWATHRADEIERLCNRVIVLIDGRLRFHDDTEAFIEISRRHMIFTIDAIAPAESCQTFIEAMKAMGLRCGEMGAERTIALSDAGDEQHLSTIVTAVIAAGGLVRQVERHAEPLHRVFSHLASAGAAAPVSRTAPQASRVE